ncbi:hypothetical protein B0H14DRAFT_2633241 [Mycena olivaceomarginata]|nr:hypothetical protein B0H14DRAFT_2633241 [Mycena olivaceomarginata]
MKRWIQMGWEKMSKGACGGKEEAKDAAGRTTLAFRRVLRFPTPPSEGLKDRIYVLRKRLKVSTQRGEPPDAGQTRKYAMDDSPEIACIDKMNELVPARPRQYIRWWAVAELNHDQVVVKGEENSDLAGLMISHASPHACFFLPPSRLDLVGHCFCPQPQARSLYSSAWKIVVLLADSFKSLLAWSEPESVAGTVARHLFL